MTIKDITIGQIVSAPVKAVKKVFGRKKAKKEKETEKRLLSLALKVSNLFARIEKLEDKVSLPAINDALQVVGETKDRITKLEQEVQFLKGGSNV